DGILDRNVTGVQTCALPICCWVRRMRPGPRRRRHPSWPATSCDRFGWSSLPPLVRTDTDENGYCAEKGTAGTGDSSPSSSGNEGSGAGGHLLVHELGQGLQTGGGVGAQRLLDIGLSDAAGPHGASGQEAVGSLAHRQAQD